MNDILTFISRSVRATPDDPLQMLAFLGAAPNTTVGGPDNLLLAEVVHVPLAFASASVVKGANFHRHELWQKLVGILRNAGFIIAPSSWINPATNL